MLLPAKKSPRVLRFELRNWRLKLPILPLNYTLKVLYGRKVIRTPKCHNTIFSKYLTLPMETLPLNMRIKELHIYLLIMSQICYYYTNPRNGISYKLA